MASSSACALASDDASLMALDLRWAAKCCKTVGIRATYRVLSNPSSLKPTGAYHRSEEGAQNVVASCRAALLFDGRRDGRRQGGRGAWMPFHARALVLPELQCGVEELGVRDQVATGALGQLQTKGQHKHRREIERA